MFTLFYEVYIISILIVLFFTITTLLILLNFLLSICNCCSNNIEWQNNDVDYFKIILILLKRQKNIENKLKNNNKAITAITNNLTNIYNNNKWNKNIKNEQFQQIQVKFYINFFL